LSEDGLVLDDGLSDVVNGHDLAGVDGGNGCGFVDVDGLCHGVGDGGQLGGHLGVGMSLSHGIGKVAAETVGLDGSRGRLRGTQRGRCYLRQGPKAQQKRRRKSIKKEVIIEDGLEKILMLLLHGATHKGKCVLNMPTYFLLCLNW
jgi:hypothetical protein